MVRQGGEHAHFYNKEIPVDMSRFSKDEVQSYMKSWVALNSALPTIGDEERCIQLLEYEKSMIAPRGMYLLRIHSRFNKLRAHRERRELMILVENPPQSKEARLA